MSTHNPRSRASALVTGLFVVAATVVGLLAAVTGFQGTFLMLRSVLLGLLYVVVPVVVVAVALRSFFAFNAWRS